MAKTLDQITYSVWEQVENFKITDDSPYPKPWLEELAVSINATLVRDAHKNRMLDQSLYLLDANLEVESMTADIIVSNMVFKNRTDLCKVDINNLIQGIGWANIEFAGSADYAIKFTRKEVNTFLRPKGDLRWTLPFPWYCIMNDTMLLKKTEIPSLQFVSISGIWRDPRKVSGYSSDMYFPTPSEYKLELLMLQQVLQSKGIPWDTMQDGQRTIVVPRSQGRTQESGS